MSRFLFEHSIRSPWISPREGDRWVVLYRHTHTTFQCGCTATRPHQPGVAFAAPRPRRHLVPSVLDRGQSNRCAEVSHFLPTSLRTGHGAPFHMRVCASSGLSCPFRSSAHFSIELGFFPHGESHTIPISTLFVFHLTCFVSSHHVLLSPTPSRRLHRAGVPHLNRLLRHAVIMNSALVNTGSHSCGYVTQARPAALQMTRKRRVLKDPSYHSSQVL